MAKTEIDVSIIIVNYNTAKLTKQCIDSVLKNTKSVRYEIIVVDNASTDDSLDILKKYDNLNQIRLVKSKKNLGFAGGNNLGIKPSLGKFVLLLNSDTEVSNDVISKMVRWMERNGEAGIAGCTLKGIDGERQSPGGKFPDLLRVFSWMTIEDLPFVDKVISPFHLKGVETINKPTKLDWVTGTFFMIRRTVIEQVGVLDDDYFMYTEEVDFCFRASKKGWKCLYVPEYEILHYGKSSSSSEFALLQEFKGVKLFYKKNYPRWQYGVVRILIKLGSLLRIIAFSIMGKPNVSKIYVKAFQTA